MSTGMSCVYYSFVVLLKFAQINMQLFEMAYLQFCINSSRAAVKCMIVHFEYIDIELYNGNGYSASL